MRSSLLIRIYGYPFCLLFALFLTAIIFRPLLPIDETRYMTAAWEMYLRKNWFSPLTINFLPYHHKPPLLFWLINLSWSIFGVSRWAGALPIVMVAGLNVFLTRRLAEKLFPDNTHQHKILPLMMIGSFPFLIYGTLIMFDITLTAFVLMALLSLVTYAKNGKFINIVFLALAMGFGVLTKGPVAWLYVIFPIILGPFWIEKQQTAKKWYGGCSAALLLSTLPVLAWLIPVLQASSNSFAFWLVWEQTAGRVTGNFSSAHVRPIYFYIPLLPVLFLPWVFTPSFWKNIRNFKVKYMQDAGLRLIMIWIVPVFVTFSLISGKQPHYLVPLLPAALIILSLFIRTPLRKVTITTTTLVCLLIGGQITASFTIFKKYDLKPVIEYLHSHQSRDWAFIRKYQGEITYLGRLEKTIDSQELSTLDEWFTAHPNGIAIIRYDVTEHIPPYNMLMTMTYRGRNIGIFSRENVPDNP